MDQEATILPDGAKVNGIECKTQDAEQAPLVGDPSRPLCPAGHLPHKGGDRQLRRPVRVSALGVGESAR
ncbi:hypothetical protein EOD08_37215 [Mesorhizobium sp. M6A.T.Ca.TU.002.02.2.1]|nr:hypothetical protein EOD08_37215 [Mesorhizobium sp. M6A.T.Ca.TU.002.02.2.1]RUU27122.1 hypothetical protein EOC94_23495 [Mesorhizobium sp. M6A.T.Ce.TU.016.01.1.1]